MRNFYKQVKDSIYNPAFYRLIPQGRLESSLSYFLKLIFALTLVQVILLAFPIFIGLSELSNKVLPDLINRYPANLQVKIENGQASTNAKEPYVVPLPNQENDVNQPKNLLVIDTKVPYSSNEFSQFDTIALLTKDTLFVKQNVQGIRAIPLTKVNNLIIDRQHLQEYLNKFSPLVKLIAPLIVFVVFLGLFVFYLLRLVYLVFLAFVIFLVSKFIKPELTYSQSYRIAIHAITLGLLVETVLTILSPILHLHGFSFMVTILAVLVYAFNFKQNITTTEITANTKTKVKIRRKTASKK